MLWLRLGGKLQKHMEGTYPRTPPSPRPSPSRERGKNVTRLKLCTHYTRQENRHRASPRTRAVPSPRGRGLGRGRSQRRCCGGEGQGEGEKPSPYPPGFTRRSPSPRPSPSRERGKTVIRRHHERGLFPLPGERVRERGERTYTKSTAFQPLSLPGGADARQPPPLARTLSRRRQPEAAAGKAA